MRFITLIFLASITCLFVMSCKTMQKANNTDIKLKNINDTVSYIFGSDVAANLKRNHVTIDPEIFIYAFQKNLSSEDSLIPQEVRQKVMAKFQKELQVKQQARNLDEAKKNKLLGEAFLKENKKKEDIIELPSGLQYKIIKQGTGKKPGSQDEVTVHYEGRFLDGKIFDSSYEKNEPVSFPVNGVIKGWTEGLQLMNEGSVYELYVPSTLGYGDNSYGQVPGGSTLIFKVELISIKAKQ